MLRRVEGGEGRLILFYCRSNVLHKGGTVYEFNVVIYIYDDAGRILFSNT